jgi:hypothetical protein
VFKKRRRQRSVSRLTVMTSIRFVVFSPAVEVGIPSEEMEHGAQYEWLDEWLAAFERSPPLVPRSRWRGHREGSLFKTLALSPPHCILIGVIGPVPLSDTSLPLFPANAASIGLKPL